MAKHAILSASGAHRWIACTPSALLEQQFPNSTSTYAEEGTLAHSLAELKLRKKFEIMKPSVYNKELKTNKDNELFTPQMEDYITDFVGYVTERFAAAKKAYKESEILIEARLDFSRCVPDGFGTGDVVITSDKYIEVIDLKYGKGVEVDAVENPQLRLYGYGAYDTFSWLYDFEEVLITINQPRLDHLSTEVIKTSELLSWADSIMPIAEQASKGEGELQAGDHCRFCRAKGVCRARAEKNLALAKYDFEDPALLEMNEIAEILFQAEELKSWVSDLQDYALSQARDQGVEVPGWKLVEGRSNRTYKDKEQVAEILKQAGYENRDIFETKLCGITAMETLLGKKFNELLKDYIVKPQGKPTLVPVSDKRPEWNSATEDFKEE